MAINVIVIRDAGDVPASDIIDPLITTEEVAVQRGTQFIDTMHKSRMLATVNGPFREWMAPGSLLEIVDSELASYKTLLTDMTISITKGETSFTVDSNISWERISDE